MGRQRTAHEFWRLLPHPTPFNSSAFYYGGQNYDWTSPQNASLWQDGIKTLFDPCPTGWRVPLSGDKESGRSPWDTFTIDNGPWEGLGLHYGRHWDSPQVVGGPSWFPCSGYRRYNTGGNLDRAEAGGFFWYSTVMGSNGRDTGFYIHIVYSTATDPRAYGFSVRCVRE